MRELNALVYSTIKNDSEITSYTGAISTDPRIYKRNTPSKVRITTAYPAFMVYYLSGTVHHSSWDKINVASKNDCVYVLEIYGKKDTTVESMMARVEKLFDEERFQTTTYIVGYTYAIRGSCSFDDARQLYFGTVSIYLTKILTLNEAS